MHQDLRSHLQTNADALCDELTANLRKLEKVTLYDIMQMLIDQLGSCCVSMIFYLKSVELPPDLISKGGMFS